MRRAKGLGFFFIVALSNAALVYGCSSDSTTDTPTDQDSGDNGNDSGKETGSIVVDSSSPDVKDAGKDAKKDTGKDTATTDVDIVDSGPDVVWDPPGSPCGPTGSTQERACGTAAIPGCTAGTQDRICINNPPDAGDSGLPGYWSDWSTCNMPASAVCDPLQTYPDKACGNCGTVQQICQLDCTFIAGLTCQNEGLCAPGTTDWQAGLGCSSTDGGLVGHTKTCKADCTYDVSPTCVPPPPNPNLITIATTTAGTVISKVFTVAPTPTEARLVTSFSGPLQCPATLSTSSTGKTPRIYVEVRNTTASALHLSIWHSRAAAKQMDDDSIMGVYAGAQQPRTDPDRLNCIEGVVDDCSGYNLPDGGQAFSPKPALGGAGLLKGDPDFNGDPYAGVPIPAKSSITVYVAPYSSSGAGDFQLNVKVEGP